jgi:hypothetical protein
MSWLFFHIAWEPLHPALGSRGARGVGIANFTDSGDRRVLCCLYVQALEVGCYLGNPDTLSIFQEIALAVATLGAARPGDLPFLEEWIDAKLGVT